MARRERDYRKEYAQRTQRAKSRGFPSYGVERKERRKFKAFLDSNKEDLTDVRELLESPQGLRKRSRIDKLRDLGASEDEVNTLYTSVDRDDFWKMYRTEYERLKMG